MKDSRKSAPTTWVGFVTFVTVALILTRYLNATVAVAIGAVVGALIGRTLLRRGLTASGPATDDRRPDT